MSLDAYLHVNPTGDLLAAVRDCEAEIFEQWYGNTRAQLEDEYGPYDEHSVFLAVTDSLGDVVAEMRLIAPNDGAGLKALNDVASEPWGVDGLRSARAAGLRIPATWEIATLGSRRRQAAARIRNAMALYHGYSTLARVNAIGAFVAILDERVRGQLHAVGLMTQNLPGCRTGSYLGSRGSTPVFGDSVRILDVQRRDFPEAFAMIQLGRGLDGVHVPRDDEFRCFGREEVAIPSWAPLLTDPTMAERELSRA